MGLSGQADVVEFHAARALAKPPGVVRYLARALASGDD
jgi:hypothetical protein